MKKSYILLILLFYTAININAATYLISGSVISKKDNSPVEFATLQLLKSDSTYLTGVASDIKGQFEFKIKEKGNFILKTSFLGFTTIYTNFTITEKDKNKNLGNISLSENEYLLKTAEVTAKLSRMVIKGDTTIYNASAYRVPEGSSLESLIEQLPGINVDDDGTIKWNGKKVTEFLTNGKDFFKGNTDIAMKNLPTELVSKIKAYDKKSDYTEMTGIDDGNETTVLDLTLKEELKASWFTNVDLATGNKDRYAEKLFLNRFTDNTRITAFGNLNNTGDQGFHGRSGRGGSNNDGIRTYKKFGMDAQWDNGIKEHKAGHLELGGNFHYSNQKGNTSSKSNSEMFLSGSDNNSFSNSESHKLNYSTNFRASLNFDWNPDSVTEIRFRPDFSHSHSNNNSYSQSATFNEDPYQWDSIPDPLADILNSMSNSNLEAITVNTNESQSLSSSNSNAVSGNLEISRRLSNKGRNIALELGGEYKKSKNKNYYISDINYFQSTAEESTKYTNNYTFTPSKDWNYKSKFSYSEPIAENIYLQASYEYERKYSDSKRSYFELDSLSNWGNNSYHVIGTLPSTADSMSIAFNMRNSQYATYNYFNHNAKLGIKWTTDKLFLSLDVSARPQKTNMDFQRNDLDTTVVRNIFNIAPDTRFRYKFSDTRTLSFNYRGYSSQPSMTDLLDITDDSNPLYITKGNPGLKPSWTNNANLYYYDYNVELQRALMFGGSFSQTSNSISNTILYNETTGVRTSKPENINGNWNTDAWFSFNTPLDKEKALTLETTLNTNFMHSVGFTSVGNSESKKNTNKTLNISDRLGANYRTDWYDIGLSSSLAYQHSTNEVQTSANMETFTFKYGGNFNINFPWSMSLSSDIGMSSRRGYTDDAMNTNELLWNAQIAQTFLNNKATVSLQLYDILHKQSNISRSLTAYARTDNWTNGINSYCMLHFIYKFNTFGASGKSRKEGHRRMRSIGMRPAM